MNKSEYKPWTSWSTTFVHKVQWHNIIIQIKSYNLSYLLLQVIV